MNSSLKVERDAARWLMRRETGNWSSDDDAQFEAWLNAAIVHRVTYLHLRSVWQKADRLKAFGAGLPDGEVPPKGQWMPSLLGRHSRGDRLIAVRNAGITRRVPSSSIVRRSRYAGIAAFAACLIVVVASGVGWFRYATVQAASYVTPIGATEAIALSDGSHATLSSASRLEARMSRQERRIVLQQGEGYFEVAKDAARPFVVEAGDRRVIAVGTRFSVRRESTGIRVVVTDGVVRLASAASAPSQADLRLEAGSVATATSDGVTVQSLAIEKADEYLSWRNGFLQFRDTPLGDAIAEFNRYNVRKLVVADARAASVRVGGNFRWSNPDAFVALLKSAFAIRVEKQGDSIVLHKD